MVLRAANLIGVPEWRRKSFAEIRYRFVVCVGILLYPVTPVLFGSPGAASTTSLPSSRIQQTHPYINVSKT